jgi:hypothetical protein
MTAIPSVDPPTPKTEVEHEIGRILGEMGGYVSMCWGPDPNRGLPLRAGRR